MSQSSVRTLHTRPHQPGFNAIVLRSCDSSLRRRRVFDLGKRFRGLTCAYCGELGISSTGDHVIPRQFVPRSLRGNLPQVPACAPCNNAKSFDEHYLATVLPFGGNHPESSAMLERDVRRRLEKNRRLHSALIEGQARVQLNEGGEVVETLAISIESDRVSRFARRVIQGLHAHHWEPIPKSTWVGAGQLAPAGVELHHRLMHMGGIRLRGDIGGGLFSYAALRSFDQPYISVWWLRLFGGVLLAGDPMMPECGTRDLYGMVSRLPHPEMFPDT